MSVNNRAEFESVATLLFLAKGELEMTPFMSSTLMT